jgi:ferredoxin
MGENVIRIGGKKQSTFMDQNKELLPEGGNLNLCLTCGACSSGCPATGLEGMDPRKFLRMAALGLDDEILNSNWVWLPAVRIQRAASCLWEAEGRTDQGHGSGLLHCGLPQLSCPDP